MIQIFVVNLRKYNENKASGEWIDLLQAPEDVWAEIEKIARGDDWAIHDQEGLENINLGLSPNIETLCQLAEWIDKEPAFVAYMNVVGWQYAAWDDFEESYVGEYEDEEEYAADLIDDFYNIPKDLKYYIDYQAYARDLFINDYTSYPAPSRKIWVFRNI